MTKQNESRLFARSRRANARGESKRDKRYEVSVTPEEDVQLRARAAVRGVTVPRLLFESAMSSHVQTDTDRKAAIVEIFAVRRLLANLANNANQLAKYANREGTFPAEADALITEYRAIVPRLSAAIETLADR
ncbi:MAG: plasmid mobilization relaxosome protein MobC [Actinobacteria bacterium]|nr:plasmid mobilization relaxosome protein MobC [Actinomycetota bacterium]